jgi:hypothetical protein
MGTDLASLNGSPLGELVEIANLQKVRLLGLFEQERKSGLILPHLTTVLRDYKDLLVNIQDMQFDLGLDEFKRDQPLTKEADRRIQEQVREAMENVEKIFRKHKIPQQIGN